MAVAEQDTSANRSGARAREKPPVGWLFASFPAHALKDRFDVRFLEDAFDGQLLDNRRNRKRNHE